MWCAIESMKKNRFQQWLGVCAITTLLAACGGGDSGGSTSSTSQSSNPSTTAAATTTSGITAGPTTTPQTTTPVNATARFSFPVGITSDAAGNLYVADTSNNTIRKITPRGVVTTIAGTAGSFGAADGIGAAARFDTPSGIAVDSIGNLYVVDTHNHAIRKISPIGLVTTLAGTLGENGSSDGIGGNARFNSPSSIAIDGVGNLYVTDTLNYTIRKVTPVGVVTTLAGLAGAPSHADGTGSAARFIRPDGITADAAGNVYITDTDYFPSCHFCTRVNSTIRKITAAGVVSTIAGVPLTIGSADGIGSAAQFAYPKGITVDAAGNLYVADTQNDTIRKIAPDGVVSTIAGRVGVVSSLDGLGTAAAFAFPKGITIDRVGNLFVTEAFTVRKISTAAQVTTFAGNAAGGGSADTLP